jgi:subtilase family serine protease
MSGTGDVVAGMGRFRGICVLACSVVTAIGLGVSVVGVDGASASTPRAESSSQLSSFAWQVEEGAKARFAGCAGAKPGDAHCYLKMLKAADGVTAATACKVKEKAGYSACNIENAYELTSLSKTKGSGETVAVFDPMNDPDAAKNMATYRKANGLPACTKASGCFRQLNQEGETSPLPAGDMSAGSEISTDLDMVSAVCPLCHIVLVEANSYGFSDLFTAISEAETLGATEITDSWGTGEFDGETGYDATLDDPGVPILFSSGDGAYQGGVQYPSASQYVVSVGGTMLKPTKTGRKWDETVWVTTPSSGEPTQGSGSGCSAYEPEPAWQEIPGNPDCDMRMTADVSAVAANVLMYDSYEPGGGGWYYDYGTSVSTPIIASVYALAGNASSYTYPAEIPYENTSHLHDITKGSTGTCEYAYYCNAEVGYDGPSGLGTPDGDGAF